MKLLLAHESAVPGAPIVGTGRLRLIRLGNLPLVTGSFANAADWLVELALAAPAWPVVVSHINACNYYYLQKRPALRDRLAKEAVLILDGIGMKIGCRILGLGWLPDLNGTDLFPFVMERASRERLRIFCLGSEQHVADAAAGEISRRYPGVEIAGSRGGFFDADEEDGIVSSVNGSGAQMLLVGRGFLRQETFALKHLARLNVSLVWNVGGLFDFVSAAKPRAPLFMRRARLEWLFRFLREPGRMWHRNLVAAPRFLAGMLCRRIRGHMQRGSAGTDFAEFPMADGR
jgi:N-acetylglucosaminyldiphosphoundecaprenol N-acetyl-beta-D-mannosaminyltransferase